MNNESINSILHHLYDDLLCKDYNAEKNISSISMGIEDWYQWQTEDTRGEFVHYKYLKWCEFPIKICKRRKRLIKFNLRLTRNQKNRMVLTEILIGIFLKS